MKNYLRQNFAKMFPKVQTPISCFAKLQNITFIPRPRMESQKSRSAVTFRCLVHACTTIGDPTAKYWRELADWNAAVAHQEIQFDSATIL